MATFHLEDSVGQTTPCGVGFLLALCLAGIAGCGASEPDEAPVGEVSQALAHCGAGGACGAGWTCDFNDNACHPICTIIEDAVPGGPSPAATDTQFGSCPAPFSSWVCCLGTPPNSPPFCAVQCP